MKVSIKKKLLKNKNKNFILRIDEYPRFNFNQPTAVPHKIDLTHTHTRNLILSNSSICTRPAADQTGQDPQIMNKIPSLLRNRPESATLPL